MADLSRAVAVHKELVRRIGEMFPTETEESLSDTVSGETRLDAAILSVLREAIHREAHADAIDNMIATLAGRKRRLVEGAQALRRAARDAMIESGLHGMTCADMTVSVRDGKPAVVIIDESAIPDIYCRFKRSVDKTAVGDVLRTGHEVPGATLGNADPVLTVRRS